MPEDREKEGVFVEIELPESVLAPAVFIDRDGTIVSDEPYLHEVEKLKVLPGALAGIRLLRESGYRIVMVTNQPGIGLGFYTKNDFFAVTKELLRQAGQAGAIIDKVYFCPHSNTAGCPCRKPKTGLIERAVADLKLDLAASYMIGDMSLDVLLGKNAGIPAILVRTGKGGRDDPDSAQADYVVDDLEAAGRLICSLRAASKLERR